MQIQNWLIREHLVDVSVRHNLDMFITISFVQTDSAGKRFCLTKKDTPDAFRMVRAYCGALTQAAFGRSNRLARNPQDWLPMILLPEYRESQTGDATFLHYHGVLSLPPEKDGELIEFTTDFWKEIGERHFKSPIAARLEKIASTLQKAALYSSEWFEDGYTLENAIICGPVIKRYS